MLPDGLLLTARHHDRDSAALSIAANRLSKVRLLLADRTEQCDRIAARNAQRLVDDVHAHLRAFPSTPPSVEARLEQLALEALHEAMP